MKKLLLSIGSFAVLTSTLMAQNTQLVTEQMSLTSKQLTMSESNYPSVAKTAAVGTNDTLWYFYNKHIYRNNPAVGFGTYKSPYPSATLVLNNPSSSFISTNTVTVNGAYVLLARQASSTHTSVPVKIYLYSVDATYKPVAKIDSGLAVVTGTAGTFAGAMFTAPKVMTNYAIGFNVDYGPTGLGDTIRPFMNNAAAPTSTLPVSQRYGESLSFLKFNNVWTSQTSFWAGSVTDFEYVTIPMVTLNLTAGFTPNSLPPYCATVPVNFTNTSTSLFTNRQYNLNQFLVTWPSVLSVTATPVADPIYTSNFGDGTGAFTTFQTSHTYAGAGVFTGTLTGKYQLGADNGQKVSDALTAPASVNICTSINQLTSSNDLVVYPNPSNGVITISNLSYNSTIELVNILGETVYKEKVSADSKSVDFSSFAKGNYYLKMTSTEGKVTVKKLNFN